MQITADCVDPLYNAQNFKILSVTAVTEPKPYTKVLAEFAGTPYQVNIYLPPREAWSGRFFQHVYPLQRIDASPGDIDFALTSGGYLVNTNGTACGCAGYRVDAAAAKLARAYAAEFYGSTRSIYGYIWGGSGGSFQTLGAIENTFGVWNGAVPYVIANEASFLNFQAMSALANFALKDKLPAIADAIGPGGGGDPRKALDADQRAIFDEALAMGIPPKGFEFLSYSVSDTLVRPTAGETARSVIDGAYKMAASVQSNDPAYVEDFWTKPGYEGTHPPAYVEAAKVDHYATITAVTRDADGKPTSISLDSAPRLGTAGSLGIENWVYTADGRTRISGLLTGDRDEDPKTLKLAGTNDPALLDALQVGAKIRINNRLLLAMMFYHRHSIPQSREYYTYAQYRAADGQPLYPQRSYSAARSSMLSTGGGGIQTGKITGKVILVGNLLDINAFPYNADIYANRVRRALGEKAFNDNFRIWFNDNANHIDRPPSGPNVSRLVTYVPVLYQALRDLSTWVEKGVAPPASTRYAIVGGQVKVPGDAASRGGIQPVVHLTVNNSKRAKVLVNQPVIFRGEIAVPPGTGKIVATAWYFGEDSISFQESPVVDPKPVVTVEKRLSFSKPGTYLVTLRAKSQRDAKLEDPVAPENIDRVRVMVE